ncbi:ABC transporter substrate-binding protein [Tundrisphaera lichenicola]|uniref:ABC transporter substrate-binding protein n=1 Tax=Tundrisphaera lichenicola TaxID=2029860 RepID=UPI003EBB16FD
MMRVRSVTVSERSGRHILPGFPGHPRACSLLLAVALASVGCEGPKSTENAPARPFAGTRLVVGVVGDPAILPSVKAQQGEWMAQTGAELSIRDEPVDPKAPGDVDILVFPGDRMGELVDIKALAILPDSEILPPEPTAEGGEPAPEPPPDTFQYKDIAIAYRDLVTRYGPDRVALPIGGSALVLAYHRKAFEDPASLEAAKAAGLALEPPKTWEQFDALARFFHGRDWDGDGSPEAGVALAWGADPEGVGDSTYLARVASMSLHPDQFSFLLSSETTEPRVTSSPFIESLRSIVALKDFGPPEAGKFDADAARQAFRSGEAAFLIDRAERAATWSTEGSAVGVAPLPGSDRLFDFSSNTWTKPQPISRPTYLPHGGGWLVGVVAASAKQPAAVDFARYLAGPDSTNRLRAERGFPMLAVRSSQLNQGLANPRSAPGVEARGWADAVSKTMNAVRVFPGLRVPDAPGYLADLTKARVAAVEGEPAEQALEGLAKAWSERTKGLGQARQTWHHRRSLNGLVTPPTPPAR